MQTQRCGARFRRRVAGEPRPGSRLTTRRPDGSPARINGGNAHTPRPVNSHTRDRIRSNGFFYPAQAAQEESNGTEHQQPGQFLGRSRTGLRGWPKGRSAQPQQLGRRTQSGQFRTGSRTGLRGWPKGRSAQPQQLGRRTQSGSGRIANGPQRLAERAVSTATAVRMPNTIRAISHRIARRRQRPGARVASIATAAIARTKADVRRGRLRRPRRCRKANAIRIDGISGLSPEQAAGAVGNPKPATVKIVRPQQHRHARQIKRRDIDRQIALQTARGIPTAAKRCRR